MTSLGTELALSFKRCFALLEDLQTLAPREHAALMSTLCEHLQDITRRTAKRDSSTADELGHRNQLITDTGIK